MERSGIASDWRRLENLIGLVRALPAASPPRPDVSGYPPDLRALEPLVNSWGVTDDSVRSERIENASDL
jgi:hypothetical protein